MHMNTFLLQAVDRLILRGRPTGQGAEIAIAEGVVLDAWPLKIRIGSHIFRLVSVQNRDGNQEAIYRK